MTPTPVVHEHKAPGIFIAAILALALSFTLALARSRTPAPLPANAPEEEFSAGRAEQTLTRLLGDERPHPVGAAAHTAMRQRLLDELRNLGLEAQLQSGWQCDSDQPNANMCVYVTNVFAAIAPTQTCGDDPAAVMLAAHYDSTGGGPGAADDGSGLAIVLESARAWQAHLRAAGGGGICRPLNLLFTDGEELGLWGARSWMQQPLNANVAAVINIEARGNQGLDYMFETGEHNVFLIQALRRSGGQPRASSFAYSLYKTLPNDTDMSAFKAGGLTGLNFAMLGNAASYHSPIDDLAHLDWGGVQHGGENVLGAALNLGRETNLESLRQAEGDAAYVDVLGLGLAVMTERMQAVAAAAALLLCLAAAWMAVRRGWLHGAGLIWGLGAPLATTLLSAGVGWLLPYLLTLVGGPAKLAWSSLLPSRLMVVAGIALVTALGAAGLGRRAGAWGAALGVWLWWAVLGVGLAFALPGVATIFVLPALLSAALLLAAAVLPGVYQKLGLSVAGLAGLLFAGLIWWPLALFIEAALGYNMGFALGAFIGLGLTGVLAFGVDYPSSPWLGRGLPIALLAAALVGFGWAALTPNFTPQAPQSVSITYLEDRAADHAFFAVRAAYDLAPQAMRETLALEVKPIYPWSNYARPAMDAPMSELPAPTLEVLGSEDQPGRRIVTTRLRSPRGAGEIDVYAPLGQLIEVRFNGAALPFERNLQWNKTYLLQCFSQECDGQEVVFVFDSAETQNVLVVDMAADLPAFAAPILAARPAEAVPTDFGDIWLISDWVALP